MTLLFLSFCMQPKFTIVKRSFFSAIGVYLILDNWGGNLPIIASGRS